MVGGTGVVDGMRVDQSGLIDHVVFRLEDSEKATRVSFVARRSRLIDNDQDRIRIAIDADLDHTLPMATFLSFTP